LRAERERLLDILDAINNIQRKLSADRDVFLADELLQVWAVHHIQIIGEAAASLSSSLRDKYSDISWIDIVSMRNILVHQYFGIDTNQIWDTVNIDLPKLKQQIKAILKDLE
jgi:uncharacterized protein with HEPN domain